MKNELDLTIEIARKFYAILLEMDKLDKETTTLYKQSEDKNNIYSETLLSITLCLSSFRGEGLRTINKITQDILTYKEKDKCLA